MNDFWAGLIALLFLLLCLWLLTCLDPNAQLPLLIIHPHYLP